MAKAVEELQSKRNYFGIIAGKPSMKKTSLAMTARRTLLIDTENGLPRVDPKYRKGFFAQCKTYQEVLDELDPRNPESVFSVIDTVVIDTLGSLFDLSREYVIEQDKKNAQGDGKTLSQKGYGAAAKEILRLCRSIIMRKNLIIIAHTTEGQDDGALRFKIACEGQTKDLIWRFADFGCFAEGRGKDVFFCFGSSLRYDSKRIGNLKDEYKYGDEDCNIGKWFDCLDNITAENDSVSKKYDSIILNARAIIEEVKTVDDANDAIGSLKELEVVGESKLVTWMMLKRHCATIGLEAKDGVFAVKASA